MMDWQTSISCASAIVALCSLGITIWQAYETRKHNKLSVQPILSMLENRLDSKNSGDLSFDVLNAGLGPAIIKNLSLLYEDEMISENNRQTFRDFLNQKVQTAKGENPATGWLVPGGVLQSNIPFKLFGFSYTPDTDIAFVEKLNIQIEYESVYRDRTLTYDSRKDRKYNGR